jgi:response regulator RpfG family c-di-GMP phosphodiesterase
MAVHATLEEIRKCRGRQFDPDMTDGFLEMMYDRSSS